LVISARRQALLEELAAEIAQSGGREPMPVAADLSTRGSVAKLAGRAREQLGQVDVLINNAGSNLHGCPSAVGDREEARELFELNFWSPLALIHQLVPEMRNRKRGMVVNVTSLAVVAPFPAVGHYCSSKAALSLATQSLRLELRGTGVDALEVLLGPIDTAGSRENRTIVGAERWLDSAKPGDPDKAALAIVRAMERRRRRLIYPRRMAASYELPVVGRLYASAIARGFDPDLVAVHRTGWRPEGIDHDCAADDSRSAGK
jgi:short-subunit dehydrogenase